VQSAGVSRSINSSHTTSGIARTTAKSERNLQWPLVAVRLRPLLVPAEHGAWSFVLEPIVLGLLVAPSRAGAALALAAVVVFLGRQPLKLALVDRASGRTYPRTVVAFRLAAAALASAALLGTLAWRWTSHRWWPPLLAAVPLGVLQLAYDVRRHGRRPLPELAGAIAASASGPAIAAAAGWRPGAWLTLWTLVAAHGLAATLYVRARLALSSIGLAPPLAAMAFALLLFRAVWGLSGWRRQARAQAVGFSEVATSVLFVLILAAVYRAA
jgi:YwiC-like protein